ncbi:MAG TPA: hypothetical protein VFL41_07455, partial [Gaiellaceae bacterium]|nr:hypothetical protein [Gaiellaceae bacterium]
MRRLGIALLSLAVLAAGPVYAAGASRTAPNRPATVAPFLARGKFVPGELVVRFRPGVPASARRRIVGD